MKRKKEEDYYKAARLGNVSSNKYIEQKSNSDRNKIYRLKNILIKTDYT